MVPNECHSIGARSGTTSRFLLQHTQVSVLYTKTNCTNLDKLQNVDNIITITHHKSSIMSISHKQAEVEF